MKPIRLPEVPNGSSALPEIFDGGIYGVINRAIVIGNGFPGAENQCLGLVRALGLSGRHSLYRVMRPRGGINEWLHWLPVSVHKKLDLFIRQFFGHSSIKVGGRNEMLLLNKKTGLSHVLEADAKQIAKVARETFDKDGPLLVIASGRDTISVASSIKRFAPENVFVVQVNPPSQCNPLKIDWWTKIEIQHPRSRLDRFDLVIAPRHDYYSRTPQARQQIPWLFRSWITPCEPPGKNVVLTVGALHQADYAALRSAASTWHDELASLPKPLLVVNIGGPSRNCCYGVDLAKQLATMLQNVLLSCGSVRISFSRRTPEKLSKLLVEEFSTHPKVYIWDGEGLNPHLGHLAWADAFVITADSVSMLSEACSTGKPVYVVGADRCTWKFADFQKSLTERGVVRLFTGKEDISESWSYSPLNDTAEAANRVNSTLAARGWRIRTSTI